MHVTTTIPCGNGRVLLTSPTRIEVEVISCKAPRYTHFQITGGDCEIEPTIVLLPDRASGNDFRKMACKTIWVRHGAAGEWALVDPAVVTLNAERIEFRVCVGAGEQVQVSTEPPRPYGSTSRQLSELAQARPEEVALHVIGASIEQRPLFLLRVTEAVRENGLVGSESRPVILLLGGEHASEFAGEELTRGMLNAILDEDEVGQRLRHEFIFDIILNSNPDGNYHGWQQYNAEDWRHHCYNDGVDRSWHHEFAGYMAGHEGVYSPETQAIGDWIKQTQPRLVQSSHSWEGHGGNIGAFHTEPEMVSPTMADALRAMDAVASQVAADHGVGYEPCNTSNLRAGHLNDYLAIHDQALAYTSEAHPYHSRQLLQRIGYATLRGWLDNDVIRGIVEHASAGDDRFRVQAGR